MAMVTLELESAEVPELGDSAAWSASPAALAAAGNAPCDPAAGPVAPELAAGTVGIAGCGAGGCGGAALGQARSLNKL